MKQRLLLSLLSMLFCLSPASVIMAEEYSDDWVLPASYLFESDDLVYAVQFSAREAYVVGFAKDKYRTHLKIKGFTLTGSQVMDQLGTHALHLAIEGEEIIADENYTFTVKGITSWGGSQNYHFNGSNIESIEMENTVEYISRTAFVNCKSLTRVRLSDNLTYLSGFSGCTGLTNIYIPNSVTTIGASAFYNCNGLNFVNIPNSVTTIGPSAFYNCKGLNYASFGNSLTSIGNGAFMYCTGLTYANIPNSVTNISERAFYGCSGLTSVTIGNSVMTIGSRAFMSCNNLNTISLGSSVTTIADRAFYGCSALKKVWAKMYEPTAFNEEVFQSYNGETRTYDFTTATLYVPYGSKAIYEETEGWKNFSENIVEFDLLTTGISDVSRLNEINKKDVYDLQGHKVQSPKKGVVIRNGRKYVDH